MRRATTTGSANWCQQCSGPWGFTASEKALGAWAAYKHPLVSGIAADVLAHSEPSPTRRRQLAFFNRAAFLWGASLAPLSPAESEP